jgi:hypothetical protein
MPLDCSHASTPYLRYQVAKWQLQEGSVVIESMKELGNDEVLEKRKVSDLDWRTREVAFRLDQPREASLGVCLFDARIYPGFVVSSMRVVIGTETEIGIEMNGCGTRLAGEVDEARYDVVESEVRRYRGFLAAPLASSSSDIYPAQKKQSVFILTKDA